MKINVNKNMVMLFERSKSEVVHFDCTSRIKSRCPKECKTRLLRERMEEVHEIKYVFSFYLVQK